MAVPDPAPRQRPLSPEITGAFVTAAAAFVDELKPVAAAVEGAKAVVVKRQPNPVGDRREKYRAPAASLGAVGIVKTLLEEVTEGARKGD